MKAQTVAYIHYGNLYLNLTNRCCNNCTFCIRNNGDGIEGNTLWLKSEPTGAEVIDEIKKYSLSAYDEIVFCGYGESTYRLQEMLEVCAYCKTIGKKTRLNTNGLGNLIQRQRIAPLLKGNIDIVSVSLNESTAEDYDKVCQPHFKNSFQAMLDFAKDCVAEKIDTVFTVVDCISPESIARCKEIAASVGCPLRIRKYISDNQSYS